MRIKNLHIMDFGILRNQTLTGIKPGIVVIAGFNRAGKTTLMNVLRYLFYGIKKSPSLPPPAQEYRVEADLDLEDGQEASIRITGYSQPEVYFSGGKRVDNRLIAGSIDDFTYKQLFTISLNELCNLPEGVTGREATKLQSVLLGAGLVDVVALPQLRAEVKKVAEGIGGKNGSPGVRLFKDSNRDIIKGIVLRDEALHQSTEYEEAGRVLAEVRERIFLTEEAIRKEDAELITIEFVNQYFTDYQEFKTLNELLNERESMEVLNNFPSDYLQKARHLRGEQSGILNDYRKIVSYVEGVMGSHVTQSHHLLKRRDEIKEANRQVAGVRQRLQDLSEGIERLKRDKSGIKLEMQEINADWDGDFHKVKEIDCDHLRLAEVGQTLTEYRTLKTQTEEDKRALGEIRREQEIIRDLLKTLTSLDRGKFLLRLFTFSLIFAMGGYFMATIQIWFGLLLGLGGILASGIYLLFRFLEQREIREKRRQLEDDFRRKEEMSKERSDGMTNRAERLEKVSVKLREYQLILGLSPDKIAPELFLEYFKRVQEIKRRISLWEGEAERLNEVQKGVSDELELMSGLAVELGYMSTPLSASPTDYLKSGSNILSCIEEMVEHLELMGEMWDYEKKLQSICRQAEEILNEGGRTRADKFGYSGPIALASLDTTQRQEPSGILSSSSTDLSYADESAIFDSINNVDIINYTDLIVCSEAVGAGLDAFIKQGEWFEQLREKAERAASLSRGIRQGLTPRVKEAFQKRSEERLDFTDELSIVTDVCNEFVSLEEAQRRYKDSEEKITSLRKRLEELKKENVTQENRLKDLATSDKLEEAQRIIDEARGRLEPLARKYAVYNVAALIFDELHKAFLEKTKGELLTSASRIFAKLTGETYNRILPSDDLLTPDFKAVHAEVTPEENPHAREVESTAFLSRGTREQLFLAVRLSRIAELKPALPVILDDSLVNFDVKHSRQAIDILSDLSRTHQIFIMTCHPEILEYIAETNRPAQYWRIAGGKIEQADVGEVIKYLHGETLDLR